MEENSPAIELRDRLELMDGIFRSSKKADRQMLLMCRCEDSLIKSPGYLDFPKLQES